MVACNDHEDRRGGLDRRDDFIAMRREDLHKIVEGSGASCWTISTRVGVLGLLGIIGTMLVNIGIAVWFFAQQDIRLTQLERDAQRNDIVYKEVIEMKSDIRWMRDQMQRKNGHD